MNDGEARRRVDSIEYLHAVVVLACVRTGLRYGIDRSDRSEAFYVKLFRPLGSPSPLGGAPRHEAERGHWWGVRVAAHLPVYRCSQDYAQIHVPRTVADPAELRAAERGLIRQIEAGGRVIADPEEVREAMFAAFRTKRDGVERPGPAGGRWRWREKSLRWKLIAVDGVPAADVPGDVRRLVARFVPTEAPAVRLTPREQSDVRHRLNARARWAYEEERAAGVSPLRR
ncbi:hypothetical protein [Alienimonas californiensis]|uniref:Uncharacterized protein n=1 Tax=Alienimonas californiensis TaxID=2527989 RepID=A0A517P4P3_9PLAN|nr:hypothetical protein [Alienimonas californiensis]QDT14358.1 hypothetical protein CA12_04310 [Alienimonas californiensis]